MTEISRMIKGLTPQLIQMGMIKIGQKGELRTSKNGKEFRMPEKLDHFIITTSARGRDDNFEQNSELMAKLKASAGQDGGAIVKNGNIIGIPIRLLYDDISLNFPTRYAAYSGQKLACYGDGETAIRDGAERECPCEWLTGNSAVKCKPNGSLICLIEQSEHIGGAYRFRTTSWNTISSIIGSLTLIQASTGGQLAFIPLHLIMQPKTVILPDGKQSTIQVVSVIFKGGIGELQKISIDRAQNKALFHRQLLQIEESAGKMDAFPDDSESHDYAAEFYPEDRSNLVDSQVAPHVVKSEARKTVEIVEASEIVGETEKRLMEMQEEFKQRKSVENEEPSQSSPKHSFEIADFNELTSKAFLDFISREDTEGMMGSSEEDVVLAFFEKCSRYIEKFGEDGIPEWITANIGSFVKSAD